MNIQRNERQYNRYWHYQCNRDLICTLCILWACKKILDCYLRSSQHQIKNKWRKYSNKILLVRCTPWISQNFSIQQKYTSQSLEFNYNEMKTTHCWYVGFACIYYRNLKTDRLIEWAFSFENNNFCSLFLFLIWDAS